MPLSVTLKVSSIAAPGLAALREAKSIKSQNKLILQLKLYFTYILKLTRFYERRNGTWNGVIVIYQKEYMYVVYIIGNLAHDQLNVQSYIKRVV